MILCVFDTMTYLLVLSLSPVCVCALSTEKGEAQAGGEDEGEHC